MALVPAYDARTGRKLRQYVPESWFDHPVLGKTVRRTPRNAAANRNTHKTPADGDNPQKEQ